MRSRPPSPAIPACPWAWPTSRPCCSARFLHFDPSAPDWPDRDRFVLSAGHGSMLLYALLYLTGYPGMDLEQLRRFRQLGSRTAGHPEFGHAPGIETTTGPLGQGLAQRRRHGARRAPSARPLRRGSGRPPHLRDRERRRPHGGHQPRGVLARRPPASRPPDRAVRRQPHLDRRPDVARLLRRHAPAVRGLWLAGRRGRRPRPRGDRGRAGRGAGMPIGRR